MSRVSWHANISPGKKQECYCVLWFCYSGPYLKAVYLFIYFQWGVDISVTVDGNMFLFLSWAYQSKSVHFLYEAVGAFICLSLLLLPQEGMFTISVKCGGNEKRRSLCIEDFIFFSSFPKVFGTLLVHKLLVYFDMDNHAPGGALSNLYHSLIKLIKSFTVRPKKTSQNSSLFRIAPRSYRWDIKSAFACSYSHI